MDIVPLGPGFAAELRGVTLSDVAADDAAYAAARAAFEEHSVLVFRDQQVTDEIQLAFSRRFGPPEVTKVGSQGTGSHVVILSTIGPDGKVVPPDHEMRTRSLRADLGHLRRPEAARKGELDFVGDFLIAKYQDRALFEGRAHRRIGGIVRGDIGQRHAAQFGAKSRTQRNDVHRQILPWS